MNILVDKKVLFTDLKPENTLFDENTRKAIIIDMGGSWKIDEKDNPTEISKSYYSNKYGGFTYTKGYCAPELLN